VEDKKKVLIITYYWPPSGGAGVQRWLKFAKYLPEFGIEPIVLTVEPKYASYPQRDDSLEKDIHPELKVFKTKSFEPLNLLSGLFGKKSVPYGGFTNVNKKSLFQTILRFIRGNFFIPDARVGWNKHAYRKAKELIAEHKIDTVITTSPPHSTQLIGLKLKKNMNVQWIADFRDPWTDIYYYKDLLHTGIVKRIDKKKERTVLENADRVITVGNALKKNLHSKSCRNDIYIISNGFDENDFEGYVESKPEKFTITYTGTLSDHYNISSFVKVCKRLKEEEKDFVVRFVGNISEQKYNEFREAGLKENLEIVGYISHQKSIQYLYNSSALLLVIPEFEGNEGILTGKLFEYLATKLPIIGLGPENGDAAEIINKCGVGKMFNNQENKGLLQFLISLFDQSKDKLVNPDIECIQKYTRSSLTGKLHEIIS